MALSSSRAKDLFSAWYHPKYACYSCYAAIAFAYTIGVHGLFRCNLLTRPAVQYPVTKEDDKKKKRVAVCTGSNTGIGFETAKQLVVHHGVTVILACRNAHKAEIAAKSINNQAVAVGSQGRAVFLKTCDLSSFASIHAFAEAIHSEFDTIDILVNNAGRNTTARSEDGYDLLFQACFLGHFLLTNLLFDLFPEDGTGRIVNLSSVKHHFQSNWTGWARLDEQHWRNSALLTYQRNESYPNAKQAAVFFTLELNRRYYSSNNTDKRRRVRAFAANPGAGMQMLFHIISYHFVVFCFVLFCFVLNKADPNHNVPINTISAVNSDIWRSANLRWLVIPIFERIFLTTAQGAATSVAAAVGEFPDATDFYLEPYWMPSSARTKAPFPVLEMMGPFVGYRVVQPRLPVSKTGIQAVGEALWRVSEELTHAPFGDARSIKTTMNSESGIEPTSVPTAPTQPGDAILKGKSDIIRSPRPAMGLITNTAPTRTKKES
jgi:NAD(P)-dependent dehydrogenase (short-subunit alcohol dehydrogenase family)